MTVRPGVLRRSCPGIVALAVGGYGSLGCGQYEWPDRTVTVPPGSFVVHEEAMLSATPAASVALFVTPKLPTDCDASQTRITLAASCADRCGPIRVARDGAELATLLGPEVRRQSTVDPDDVERAYATPPVDGSRTAIAIPVSERGSTVTISSKCSLAAKASGGPAPEATDPHALVARVPPGCGYAVEVTCK